MDNTTQTKRSRIAEFVDNRLEELKGVRSQKEVASIVGYNSPNMITMIKQGDTKVALDRIGALANALDVDQDHLFRLALEQFYSKETVDVIAGIRGAILSKNEQTILEVIRDASDQTNPKLSPEKEKRLREIFSA